MRQKNTMGRDTKVNSEAFKSYKPIEVDQAIVAEIEGSIYTRSTQVAGSLFAMVYETACNAPSVYIYFTTSSPEIAQGIQSAMMWVPPIYGAMALGAAIPWFEQRHLKKTLHSYILSGDESLLDLTGLELTSKPGHEYKHYRGEERKELAQKAHKIITEHGPGLSQRVDNVGRSLRTMQPINVGKAVCAASYKILCSTVKVAGIMAKDIVTAPKALATTSHAYLINLRQGFDIVASFADTSFEDQYATAKRNLRKKFKKLTTNPKEEKELGEVVDSEDSQRRVDMDHLDRILRIGHRAKWKNIGLSAATFVGRAAETVFAKKYVMLSIPALGAAWSSVNRSWSESPPLTNVFNEASAENILHSIQTLSSKALNTLEASGGDLGNAAVLTGTALLAMAALSHMDHTQIDTDRDLRSKMAKWLANTKKRRSVDAIIKDINEQTKIIFNSESEEEKQDALKRVTVLSGRITPRSLPDETLERLKAAQRDNADAAEFGINL